MWMRPRDELADWTALTQPEALIASVRAGACLDCALDLARDEALSTRWLAAHGASARDAPGVVLCPAHTWRVALIALGSQTEAAAEAARANDLNDLGALYARALGHLLSGAQLAMTRLERSGAARWFQLSGALTPGWFATRPACPLCAQLVRTTGRGDLRATLGRWLEEQPPDMRARVDSQTCGSHRARQMAIGAHTQAADAAQARWWLSPGAPSLDLAFIRRLLRERGEPPFCDELCPLCVARVEHERALVAALAGQPGAGAGASSLSGASEERPGGPGNPGQAAAPVETSELCARHTALFRMSVAPVQSAEAGGSATEEPARLMAQSLAHAASGVLRAQSREHECPVCAILHAWELARLEGLHRAAGGAPLSEAVTSRLVWELGHANLRFCAPHLRALLHFGPAETTWAALGPTIARSLEDLRDRLQSGTHRAHVIGLAAAALGGLPA